MPIQIKKIQPGKAANDCNILLSTDDAKLFGHNRFPKKYKKLKMLGKGGCAIVHLGQSLTTGEKFAIK